MAVAVGVGCGKDGLEYDIGGGAGEEVPELVARDLAVVVLDMSAESTSSKKSKAARRLLRASHSERFRFAMMNSMRVYVKEYHCSRCCRFC